MAAFFWDFYETAVEKEQKKIDKARILWYSLESRIERVSLSMPEVGQRPQKRDSIIRKRGATVCMRF